MKNFFLACALMLFSLAASAQTTYSITIPQNVATKEWIEQYVNQRVDSMLVVLQSTPGGSTNPTVKCDEGPVIKSISNVTSTALTTVFHGVNVKEMNYRILQNGVQVYTKPVTPKSNTLRLTYDSLKPGTYTLYLAGVSCLGIAYMDFVVK